MGWNGSENKNAAPVPKKTVKPPSKWRGLVALAVVVAGGVAAWFALRPAASEPEAKDEAQGVKSSIAEVAPQLSTNEAETAVADKAPAAPRDPNAEPPNTYRDANGVLRKPGGMRVKDPKRKHVKVEPPKWMKEPIFRNAADREIASILSLEPGRRVYGSRQKYDANFERQFVEALTSGDQINEGDSERVKALKREVYEAKKELAERIKGGENLGDILEEARREQQSLANYRDNILKQLGNATKEGNMSDEDISDYVKAANKMLAAKGMRELKETSFIMRNMKLREKNSKQPEGKK